MEGHRHNEAATLAARACAGDRDAYAELVCRAYPRLAARAFARLGDRQLAEDAVQEAVLDGLLHVGQLRDPESFDAWLDALVRARCERERTRGHRVREVRRDSGDAPARDADPLERLWIAGLLATLEARRRHVVAGYYLGGLSVAELSVRAGRPEGTIKRWLSEGRAALRAAMEEEIAMQKIDERPVLVVGGEDFGDDERAGIERAAARAGLIVRFGGAAREALSLVEELHPPVVLLGRRLGGPCDTIAVLLWLTQIAPASGGCAPRVVVLGPAGDFEVFVAWKAGADCYLTRPADEEELARFLTVLLAQTAEAKA